MLLQPFEVNQHKHRPRTHHQHSPPLFVPYSQPELLACYSLWLNLLPCDGIWPVGLAPARSKLQGCRCSAYSLVVLHAVQSILQDAVYDMEKAQAVSRGPAAKCNLQVHQPWQTGIGRRANELLMRIMLDTSQACPSAASLLVQRSSPLRASNALMYCLCTRP